MAEEKRHNGKKALFCASAASHIINFHNGYLESLSRMGFEIHAAAGINSHDNSELGLICAQKTFKMNFEKGKMFFLNIASAFALAKIMRREKYDIISTHSMLAGFVGRLAVLLSREKNAKVVHSCHGYLFEDGGILPNPKLLAEKFLAKRTDLLFVMNSDDCRIAKKHRLCKRIEHIDGMGLNPGKIESDLDLRKYGIPDGKKYILCVGEFSKRKSQKTVILAFGRFLRGLPEDFGEGCHLVFLGAGKLLARCRRLCEKLGIMAHVIFAGYVGDASALYRRSHLVVSASRFEGLPFNVMEALHYGKPVIASNAKGHKDLITHGFNGFLFDFGDHAALSGLFSKAFDANVYERLKSNAKLEEKYYFDNAKQKILDCYRDILPRVTNVNGNRLTLTKKIKDGMYHALVETNPHVKYHHQKYVSGIKRSGRYNPALSLLYLAKLTLMVRLLRSKKYADYAGKPYFGGSESGLSHKIPPEEYAKKLLAYDIISFDVFDTLVFRPFSKPSDLFHVVGQKLEYMDFAEIRIQSEKKARGKKRELGQSDEIDICDIYEYMEKYCGIDAKLGVAAEYGAEFALAYANPFMKQLYDILVANGKKIIAATDMYLTRQMIKNILDNCGYNGISEIFASNAEGCSKHGGKLFLKLKQALGENLRYAHIGDNWKSDYENPKKHEIESMHYENVNHKGAAYRASGMSAIVGSAYAGIVNAQFHCGRAKYSMAYEYGFMCGGIFVLGYCGFIHEYAKNGEIDKILFLSRDGEILKKTYDRLYPENNSEYVHWSRNAAAKLGFGKYRHDFIRRFVHHKVNSGATVQKVFAAAELDSLLPRFEKKHGISKDDSLDPGTAEAIGEFLASNREEILRIYSGESEAAKKYFRGAIGECKRVCTVDIGWAGSGGAILAYLAKEVWGFGCGMTTLLAGTNTARSHEPNMSEGFLQSGQMAAYMYSQSHNRDLYNFHDPDAMHNVFFEMMLASKSPSLKGFKNTESGTGFEFAFAAPNRENDFTIDEIHRGISDFVEIYAARFEKYPYMLRISGSDAYAPFMHLAQDKNRYFRNLFENLSFDIGVGDEKAAKIFNSNKNTKR